MKRFGLGVFLLFLLFFKILQFLVDTLNHSVESLELVLVIDFGFEVRSIECISFGLVEHDSFDNSSKISFELIFNEGKGQETGEFDSGEYLLFFDFVFHFNLMIEELINSP